MKPLLGFLSIFLLGLVSGVSFSHLLQRGPKATLSGVQFLAVQQVLLRNYGRVIGSLEVAALENGYRDRARRSIVLASSRSYREAMRGFAAAARKCGESTEYGTKKRDDSFAPASRRTFRL